MSGVFRNIDPPPPHRPASVYPPAFGAGIGQSLARGRGGGSIVRKTPDIALYSIYVSTLWVYFSSKLPSDYYKQNSKSPYRPILLLTNFFFLIHWTCFFKLWNCFEIPELLRFFICPQSSFIYKDVKRACTYMYDLCMRFEQLFGCFVAPGL
jgi:hypothetical protein